MLKFDACTLPLYYRELHLHMLRAMYILCSSVTFERNLKWVKCGGRILGLYLKVKEERY